MKWLLLAVTAVGLCVTSAGSARAVEFWQDGVVYVAPAPAPRVYVVPRRVPVYVAPVRAPLYTAGAVVRTPARVVARRAPVVRATRVVGRRVVRY